MNPSRKIVSALLLFTAYCVVTTAGSAISISFSNLENWASSSGASTLATFAGTSIPESQDFDLTSGTSRTQSKLEYLGSGNQVTLKNTFSHQRGGGNDGSRTVEYNLQFIADADGTYTLSGAFSASDVDTAGILYFNVYLFDIGSVSGPGAGFLFNSLQTSMNTLNESFLLGGNGGDLGGTNSGSLSGTLIAGHFYKLFYHAGSGGYLNGDGGGTATGFVRLDIGGGAPASSVPDGVSSIALLGLAISACAFGRRKFLRA